MKILSNFKYKYEYTSPFGESWVIYRLLFNFIPIKYCDFQYNTIDDKCSIENKIKLINKNK